MKCLCVPEEQIPMEHLDAEEDLSYQEYPIINDVKVNRVLLDGGSSLNLLFS
jgi:hypothetical protein